MAFSEPTSRASLNLQFGMHSGIFDKIIQTSLTPLNETAADRMTMSGSLWPSLAEGQAKTRSRSAAVVIAECGLQGFQE
jgi:hypothetical protein